MVRGVRDDEGDPRKLRSTCGPWGEEEGTQATILG